SAKVFEADAGVDEDGYGANFEEGESGGKEVNAGFQQERGAGASGEAKRGESAGESIGVVVELLKSRVRVGNFADVAMVGIAEEGVSCGLALGHGGEVGRDVLRRGGHAWLCTRRKLATNEHE